MQREIRKYAHGLCSIYVHMSFKVKYCHEVFGNKKFREACQACFRETAEEYKINVFSMGFDLNHVHMILDLGKYDEPYVRKLFKGRSGRFLLEKFPEVKKKDFYGSGLWGRQYYCYSIGSDMKMLQNYVAKQKFFLAMNNPYQKSLEAF